MSDEIFHIPGEHPVLPDEVIQAPEGVTVVTFLDPEASPGRPGAGVALRAAERWSATGRPVVLADLHLSDPILHRSVDLPNLEGVTDILLYGASVARSARPVPDRSIYLISAGTYVTDTDPILRHGRWPTLVEGFRDEGALLVLYAPASAEAALREAGWVERWIHLRAPEVTGGVDDGVPNASAPEAPASSEGIGPRPTPRAPAAPSEDEPAEPIGLIATRTARRRKRHGTASRAVVWLVLVLVLLLVAALVALVLRPDGFLPWGEAAGVTTIDDSGLEVVPDGVAPISPALPFSVEVRNYASFDAAHERIEADRERMAGGTLFVSPVLDRGVMYYRIFAGPAADTAEAAAMRVALSEAGVVSGEPSAARADRIERTPLAYDLGARRSNEAAARAVDSLAALNIPAYAVPVRYDDGMQRWRLYGGAYADSVVAESMGRLLESAGMPARLVERVGTVPVRAE